jgi:hypothetical protein
MKKEKKQKCVPTQNTISNCNCTGVIWDGQAIEAINYVARGLMNLTEVFRSQNIQIDSMIKVEGCNCNEKHKKEFDIDE